MTAAALPAVMPSASAQVALQEAYVKPPNTDPGDRFGSSCAVDGDTMVIGAPIEASAEMGVNGNILDNTAPGAGAAYVYRFVGGQWTFESYLKASNAEAGDRFGFSVALFGDYLAVGAPDEASAAVGVGGDESSNGKPGSGAVYVFKRTGSTWVQEAYIKASNSGQDDQFGTALAVDGSWLVAGAPGEASGDAFNPQDDTAAEAGAAYVFERIEPSGVWTERAYLKPNQPDPGDEFGAAVDLSGGLAIVGAPREDGASRGIGGDESSNGAFGSGAAYLFERGATAWAQAEYFKSSNSDAGDEYGASVAIDGFVAAVGAPREDSASTGLNGDEASNGLFGSGAAYAYTLGFAGWLQTEYVKASNTGPADLFGFRVALSQSLLVVGAYGEASPSSGVGASQSGNSAARAGAVYVFTRVGGNVLGQVEYIKASNAGANDLFGGAVAVDGDWLLVGSNREDGSGTGVGASQLGNSATESGAAYIFDLLGGPISNYCVGIPNSSGAGGVMSASGSSSLAANDLVLEASSLPMNAFGYFLVSRDRGISVMPNGSDGTLCLGGAIGRYSIPGEIQNSGSAGMFSLGINALAIPQPTGFQSAAAGEAWHFQAWFRDSVGGVLTSNFTDGLTVVFE